VFAPKKSCLDLEIIVNYRENIMKIIFERIMPDDYYLVTIGTPSCDREQVD